MPNSAGGDTTTLRAGSAAIGKGDSVMFAFICNVCGARCAVESRSAIGRETPSCHVCGSSSRMRWLVHAVSMGLFRKSLTLPDFPVTKQAAGVGLSDWDRLAGPLADKLGYINTFYHTEPKLDIARVDSAFAGRFDFIIASEVFEHIEQPLAVAFAGLATLLKPGGFVVFSVPWAPDGHTREHFPELHDWHLKEQNGRYILVNTTVDGRLQTYENLVFHGGPGQTLEMRLFSKMDLVSHFTLAGLDYVRFAEVEENLDYGIIFEPWSRGLVARRRSEPAARVIFN
jgi:hypothetical protein